jgi:RNA polymerase sigma factor (sigma-70 family)
MSEDDRFEDLIDRIREGDGDAAAKLVRLYEMTVRRMVRVRLGKSSLRLLMDSTDFCQSVLGNFFVRVAAGQFDLDTPADLLKLLAIMVRNRIADEARKQNARRRGGEHAEERGDDVLATVVDRRPGPSQTAAFREQLQALLALLPCKERHLAELRAAGCDWPSIAATQGSSPETLRKRLARAVKRAAKRLGLEEVADD